MPRGIGYGRGRRRNNRPKRQFGRRGASRANRGGGRLLRIGRRL